MRVRTVRHLGAAVRAERKAQGLTQADLASRLQVSRDWVVRLEQGHPRLEAQRVLDALVVLGVPLELPDQNPTTATSPTKDPTARTAATRSVREGTAGSGASAEPVPAEADPFAFLEQGR